MPSPRPGDGDIDFGAGQVIPIGVLYICPFILGAPTPPPGVALGDAEPAGPWARVGLLEKDMYTIADGNSGIVEYRRGFHQRYFGEVVNKAGQRTLTAQIAEPQPEVIANILGLTITGSHGAQQLDIATDELVDQSLLAVFNEALRTGEEGHIYCPHVRASWKFAKAGDFMILDYIAKFITFKNGATPPRFVDSSFYYFGAP